MAFSPPMVDYERQNICWGTLKEGKERKKRAMKWVAEQKKTRPDWSISAEIQKHFDELTLEK